MKNYPKEVVVLACDWSEELYEKIHKITVEIKKDHSIMLSECTLKLLKINGNRSEFEMDIANSKLNFSIVLGGERGHTIEGLDKTMMMIEGLKNEPLSLKKFFEQHPPTMFLLNGSTISGCIMTIFNQVSTLTLPDDRIEAIKWENVQFTIESMYKSGESRKNSVQEYMMNRLMKQGARVVFNDDNSGESADIVAIFHDNDVIRFELVHCKYSKSASGARLNDLYEVCGQAVVSLRYKWKPEELLRHMERRDANGVLKGKRFYHGSRADIESVRKALRYSEVKFEFAIAQPGVNTHQLTIEMRDLLSSVYATVVEMTETRLKCYFSV